MKLTKITWISFIVALATLNLPAKTKAHQVDSISPETPQMLESRLAKIAATLKERENTIPASSTLKKTLEIAGWVKGRRGGFANGGGGGFLNRRGWGDGGG
ncbi:MAG: GrrA/OscA1 family cyclophane-containing rSAM-modified RiPP, partial [Xenococcus sp. (in: cyanobacteria)]